MPRPDCWRPAQAVCTRDWRWLRRWGTVHPLAPRRAHFPPKAERLIVVFLTGGYSQVDTFDPKPRLTADHGKPYGGGFLLGSPFKFQACGQSGLMLSELFPNLAARGRRAVRAALAAHRHRRAFSGDAGHAHRLGHRADAQPGGVGQLRVGDAQRQHAVVHGAGRASALRRAQVWDNSFLPPHYQGVRITPGDEPIPDLRSTRAACGWPSSSSSCCAT